MSLLKLNEQEKQRRGSVTFEEMMEVFKTRPKTRYLWSGIKEKSFGIVFGPSKSGKTIMCENLAMSIAVGRNSFFDYPLSGTPEKVLFIGLEEFWENRVERNLKQFNSMSSEERELLKTNYLYQHIDFTKHIVRKKDWADLREMIIESEAKVVFIDSITRLNHGKLEDSKTAEEILQNLRSICYDLGVTLVCIHHTPKMYDKLITMDCIKGSSVFAQETDFAVGINKTSKGNRYIKNVFFRYAPDDDENVKEFVINEDIWLNYDGEAEETELMMRTDRRKTDNKELKIVSYLDENSSKEYKTKELIQYFTSTLSINERQLKNYLSSLSKKGKILNEERGCYKSVNYKKPKIVQ